MKELFVPAAQGIRAVFISEDEKVVWIGDAVVAWQIPAEESAPFVAIGTDGPIFWDGQYPAYRFPDGHVESGGEVFRSAAALLRHCQRVTRNLKLSRAARDEANAK